MANDQRNVPHVSMPLPPNKAPFFLEEGSVVFRRVGNGWITEWVEEASDSKYLIMQSVHEERDDSELAPEEALANALRLTFEEYTQSKWRGGLTISVAQEGREVEAEAHELVEALLRD